MASFLEKAIIVFDPITPNQSVQVCDVINRAFAADKFFKKPEYFDRETVEHVAEIASQGKNAPVTFLVGVDKKTDTVIAAIHIEWQVQVQEGDAPATPCSFQSIVDGTTSQSLTQASQPVRLSVNGHFSEVSVDPSLTNMGIGRLLIKATEDHTVTRAKEVAAILQQQIGGDRRVEVTASTDMIVLDVRPELRPWYERQGYIMQSENNVFEYAFICREDYPPITTSHLLKQLL